MTTVILEGKEYQLDIEQAEKLGLLTEKDNRVKSWEEFKEKYKNSTKFIETNGIIGGSEGLHPDYLHYQITYHEAEALSAFSKLIRLRRDWIGEWEPDLQENDEKFIICRKNNHIIIFAAISAISALSFPTKQMAEEFLEAFRDLIEEAKILI